MNALTLTAPGQLEYGRVPDPEVGPGDALIEDPGVRHLR